MKLEGVQRINESAGAFGKYCHLPAVGKVAEEYQQGKIQNADQMLSRYAAHLQSEVATFEREIQPGYKRDSYNGYTPADKEVSDYIAERRAQQQAQKDEGRRIASVHNTPGNRK